MEQGYVKLWRKSLSTGLLQNPKLWAFWCWCLLKAVHKPAKQMVGMQVVALEPGQFVFGRKAAAHELKMSEKSVRTCLQNLKKMDMLTSRATNKFSVISIINWDTYQAMESPKGQQGGHQGANKGPAKGRQRASKINSDTNGLEGNSKGGKTADFQKRPKKGHKQEDKKEEIKRVSKETLVETPVSTPVCPHEKIRALYNAMLPELPTCTVRNKSFDAHTRARWTEDPARQNLDWWKDLFTTIRNSDFLMGRTHNSFNCSLDWIVKPANLAKILNGNYQNRPGRGGSRFANGTVMGSRRMDANLRACQTFIEEE